MIEIKFGVELQKETVKGMLEKQIGLARNLPLDFVVKSIVDFFKMQGFEIGNANELYQYVGELCGEKSNKINPKQVGHLISTSVTEGLSAEEMFKRVGIYLAENGLKNHEIVALKPDLFADYNKAMKAKSNEGSTFIAVDSEDIRQVARAMIQSKGQADANEIFGVFISALKSEGLVPRDEDIKVLKNFVVKVCKEEMGKSGVENKKPKPAPMKTVTTFDKQTEELKKMLEPFSKKGVKPSNKLTDNLGDDKIPTIDPQ